MVYESSFSAIIELVGSLATALIIWYGGGQTLRGALTFGTLVAFLEYMNRFFAPIRDLSGFYAVMQSAMASLERLFALLDTDPVIGDPSGASAALSSASDIEFDHVDFSYKPDEKVLHDVSFRVNPGETVAVVGATGAGKTTLIKLLIRLYEPTAGTICIDGRALSEIRLSDLRHHVGVVMQDHFLTDGTVAGNIAFGDDSIERSRLIDAARVVHADRFIDRLPGGYDEHVRERGNNFSVGQKQLISFARALVRDPAILDPRRSDLERRWRNGSLDSGCLEPAAVGAHLDHHRPPAVDHHFRRSNPGVPSRPAGRAGNARRPAGAARCLRQTLPPSVRPFGRQAPPTEDGRGPAKTLSSRGLEPA